MEDKQKARLKELRQTRDNAAVSQTLAQLKTAAQGADNLMPPILSAVRTLATLGEICDTLREVFGEYEAPALV
jgi:methylmalonyl-CoA mutase N-terminal domain/subunit